MMMPALRIGEKTKLVKPNVFFVVATLPSAPMRTPSSTAAMRQGDEELATCLPETRGEDLSIDSVDLPDLEEDFLPAGWVWHMLLPMMTFPRFAVFQADKFLLCLSAATLALAGVKQRFVFARSCARQPACLCTEAEFSLHSSFPLVDLSVQRFRVLDIFLILSLSLSLSL